MVIGIDLIGFVISQAVDGFVGFDDVASSNLGDTIALDIDLYAAKAVDLAEGVLKLVDEVRVKFGRDGQGVGHGLIGDKAGIGLLVNG